MAGTGTVQHNGRTKWVHYTHDGRYTACGQKIAKTRRWKSSTRHTANCLWCKRSHRPAAKAAA